MLKDELLPRHVIVLIPSLNGGGAERVILTLVRHLDRSQFTTTLVVMDGRDSAYLSDIPSDVEFIDLKCSRLRYALPRLFFLIWKRKPDVVFSTLGYLNLALAVLRTFLPATPRYVAREATMVSQSIQAKGKPGFWRWMYRHFYSKHDLVVCQSTAMRDDLVTHFQFPIAQTVIVNNPVDMERINELSAAEVPCRWGNDDEVSAKSVKLLAVGSLYEVKGFDLLIEALALLGSNHYLTILGDGPLRGSLERKISELGLSKRVRLVGFQANPYAWFVRADAFVLSSRHEGFPNVVLEALACGTPVISTPAPGGVGEILEGIAECVLAKEISSKALADAITIWSATDRKRVGRKALKPYELSNIIAKYEAIFGDEKDETG